MSTDLATLALATARFPQFVPDGVAAETAKSLIVTGRYAGRPAVAKMLTATEPLWLARWHAEVHAYRTFTADGPPVTTPQLLADAADDGLLILSRLPGRPLAAHRHPPRALPRRTADAAIAALTALGGWTLPAGAFGAVFDYRDRLDRYGPAGYAVLTADDVDRLTVLHTRATGRDGGWAFAHGDTIPANILAATAGGGRVGLLDWEWAGLYLPGYDLALLWTVLAADPGTRQAIEATIGTSWAAAWWLNAAITVSREIRIHGELPAGRERERRLASLDRDLRTVRAHLTALTR